MAPLPSFDVPRDDRPARITITRSQAAARLGMSPAGVDKLIRAGVLHVPLESGVVDELAARPFLRVRDGELTVLRTDARDEAYPGEDRRYIGFHVDMTLTELEDASLRWWRCDPQRVVDNELLAVCVATVPVAVYAITGHVAHKYRDGEDQPRHHFSGRLVARLTDSGTIRHNQNAAGYLRPLATQILAARVHAPSGGPIAYLARHEHPTD